VKGETRKESACWRAVFREIENGDRPLQMFLLLDQLIAERAKNAVSGRKRCRATG
jgi:hypothetical protein